MQPDTKPEDRRAAEAYRLIGEAVSLGQRGVELARLDKAALERVGKELLGTVFTDTLQRKAGKLGLWMLGDKAREIADEMVDSLFKRLGELRSDE